MRDAGDHVRHGRGHVNPGRRRGWLTYRGSAVVLFLALLLAECRHAADAAELHVLLAGRRVELDLDALGRLADLARVAVVGVGVLQGDGGTGAARRDDPALRREPAALCGRRGGFGFVAGGGVSASSSGGGGRSRTRRS
jgi:hypothetical protein